MNPGGSHEPDRVDPYVLLGVPCGHVLEHSVSVGASIGLDASPDYARQCRHHVSNHVGVHLGSIFGPFWVHRGSSWDRSGVRLASSWCRVWGRSGVEPGSTWGRFDVSLGSFWGRVGVDSWPVRGLGSIWDRCGVHRGSIWARSGPPDEWFRGHSPLGSAAPDTGAHPEACAGPVRFDDIVGSMRAVGLEASSRALPASAQRSARNLIGATSRHRANTGRRRRSLFHFRLKLSQQWSNGNLADGGHPWPECGQNLPEVGERWPKFVPSSA